jgi:DUF1009 family protein
MENTTANRAEGADAGTRRVGLVAGGGQFPLLFSEKARRRGFQIFAAAHENETEPVLAGQVDGCSWVHLGELGKIIRYFQENRVTEAVMVGAITKIRAFEGLRLDDVALRVFAALGHTQDDVVLRAVAKALEDEGIRVRSSTWLLPELLAPEGAWTKRTPSAEEWADARFGFSIAKKIGALDIGQCVVVKKRSVLAVEAIDGTDATIERGGALSHGGAVVVKVSKPNQDPRFDLPACGAGTVRTMHEAGAAVLAVEAGRAVVFDKDEMVVLADALGVSIVGVREEAGGG